MFSSCSDNDGWPCPLCSHPNAKESRQCSECESLKPETCPSLSYVHDEYASSVATRSREINSPIQVTASQHIPNVLSDVVPFSANLSNTISQASQLNAFASDQMSCFPNGTQPVTNFNSSVTNGKSIKTSQELSAVEPLLTWQKYSAQSRDIRTAVAVSLRESDGEFVCNYLQKNGNFFIPAELRSLPMPIQAKLFSMVCDIPVQKELEKKAINWWLDNFEHTSRLIALLNRANGDCLLDSLMQASFGVVDSDSFLRKILASSFLSCKQILYEIWFEHEKQEADAAEYELSKDQVLKEWQSCLKVATSSNEPLEQIHIFILANIFRRPIIVYSVESVLSLTDDLPLEYSKFQGIYLPFLWEKDVCLKVPLVVGYTPGHFSALVPIAPFPTADSSEISQSIVGDTFIFLPLFDIENTPMPVHFSERMFTSAQYSGAATEDLIRDWMVTITTPDDQLWVKVSHTNQNDVADALFGAWMEANFRNDTSTASRPGSPNEMLFAGIDVPFSADKTTKEKSSSTL
ncbi:unnamed protein product [Rodentolepis nana]|uniref:ubiquitinyl hydrolase 1 n=1 Tax=Rodentolepis nana TaxID=102285 RepID=A0A0R3T395_RODNA|nr:unnamed protein product [Rodentolepis nana]